MLLGIVGSFVGGFIGYLIFSHDLSDGPFQAGGIFGSIIGAVIALLIYNKASTGQATRSPERALSGHRRRAVAPPAAWR